MTSKTSLWFLLVFCKIASSLVIGLTIGIIIQTLTNSGTFSLVFMIIAASMAFLKLVWHYKFMGLAVINLFFISLFLILKLYISMSIA